MTGAAAYAAMIRDAADTVRTRLGDRRPRVAIVLGSGLGQFAERLADPVRIPYAEIPHFPAPTVIGHSGELVAGTLAGRQVLAQSGRFSLHRVSERSHSAGPEELSICFSAGRETHRRLSVMGERGWCHA